MKVRVFSGAPLLLIFCLVRCAPTFRNPLLIDPFVLGQPDASTNLNLARGLTSPYAVTTNGSVIYVTDQYYRAVRWSTFPTGFGAYPDSILGQSSLTSGTPNPDGATAGTLSRAGDIVIVGSRLFVADTYSNRVLIWNTLPSSNAEPPSLVLGQTSFTASSSGTSATTMNGPTGVHSDGTRVWVADSGNNRVLVWSAFPTTNGQAASFALGQPNLDSSTANQGADGAKKMSGPSKVRTDGTRLFVSDTSNHRVLVWSALPTVMEQSADFALGQTSTAGLSSNQGGAVGAGTLNSPGGICLQSNKLVVADTNNHRVLIWSPTLPTVSGESADFVFGQPDATTRVRNATGITSKSLYSPTGVSCEAGPLLITDSSNHRVLVLSEIPSSPSAAAGFVLGQPDFSSASLNNPGLGANRLNDVASLDTDGTRLIAADYSNNRVLIWNTIPRRTEAPADIVLGQPNMETGTENTGGISASTMRFPSAARTDGTRLFVADFLNNRVLIWNTFPTASGQAADVVLGQADFVVATSNTGGISASSVARPIDVHSDGTRLFVADTGNHRILVWNHIPTTNNAPADYVIGQTSLSVGTLNGGSISGATLNDPRMFSIAADHLVVADAGNSRVLIWNSIPTTSGVSADVVLGQPDFVTSGPNQGGVSAHSLKGPYGVFYGGGQLYVADYSNHRILAWNGFPTTHFADADRVLGQAAFSSNAPNSDGLSRLSLAAPTSTLVLDGGFLLIGDAANCRILGFPTGNYARLDDNRPFWAGIVESLRALLGR